MRSKPETVAILEKLRNAFQPPPDIAAGTWRIYRDALSDIEPDVLRGAALLLVKTRKWFPSIAEIREACLEISGERAQLPAAGEAYAEARRGAAQIGAYAKPTAEDFSHAIVHRAALQAAGSWRRWCLTDMEAPLRAKFFEVYRELRDREVSTLALPKSARQLTAEESRQLLQDIETRAARETKQLGAGASPEALKPIHELFRAKPPVLVTSKPKTVGAELSQAEWEAKKNELLKRVRAS